MDNSEGERREHPRIRMDLDVWIARAQPQAVAEKAILRDLSVGGMSCLVKGCFQKDEDVEIRIRFPDHKTEIEIDGWVRYVSQSMDLEPLIGVQFVVVRNLSPESFSDLVEDLM